MKRKLDKYREEYIGETWFSFPRYNKSSPTCHPNMTIPACMVVEKSWTKNFNLQRMEGKKIGQIQGRIRGESWFLIPPYNKSSPTCIPNVTILSCMFVEKSLIEKFHKQELSPDSIARLDELKLGDAKQSQ